jgi:hypothetical protein
VSRRHALARVVAAVAIGALAACGSSAPDVTAPAARTLHDGVQLVRAAAVAHDRAGATAAVDHLEQTLATLRSEGKVTAAAQARIRRAIESARARLDAIPTTTTTTTTTTRPEPDHGKPKPHGKDRHGHDD